jgi:DNA (cytosine-5)-methyltransferase 1
MVLDLQVEEVDPRPNVVEGMVNIPACKVLRKRELIVTNKPYPMLSFRDTTYPMLFPSTILEKDIMR